MKRKLYIFLTTVFMLAFMSINLPAMAQPHPDMGHQQNGDQQGTTGGAPVGNGTFILLMLAVAYAGRKAYNQKQQEEE